MSKDTSFPSFQEIIAETWGIFQQRIGKLLLLAAGVFIVQTVLSLFLFAVAAGIALGFGNFDFAQFWSAPFATTPMWVLISLGVLAGFYVLVQIITAMCAFIANYLAIEDEHASIGALLKRSLPFVFPVIGTQLLAGLIVAGNFFIFFIPGMIATFFFMFVTPIILYEKKSFLQALRSSVILVSQHSGNLFVKLVIPFVLSSIVQSAVFSMIKTNPSAVLTLQLPLLLINTMYSYFMMIYVVVLYKHAKSTLKVASTSALRWLTLIALLGYVCVAIFMVVTIRVLQSPAGQQFIESLNEAAENEKPRGRVAAPVDDFSISADEAYRLGKDTFYLINSKRIALGYKPLKENDKLCAYTKRRMDVFEKTETYDEGQGLFEDLKNPAIGSLYFSNYTHISEYLHETATKATTSEGIVNVWMNPESSEDNNEGLLEKSLNEACLLSNTSIMMMVTSGPSRNL
ncbi:hypothetical protein KBD71_02920 [Candidatus Woesebacteria bacterium]|nr:hypothetical protein [Candidatus Woesebacteria bacterium]